MGLHVVEEDHSVMHVGVEHKDREPRSGIKVTDDIPAMNINGKTYKDDLTGLPLDEGLVRAAIAK